MTRINQIYNRIYDNGYDVSGYANQIGDLDWSRAFTPQAAFSDDVMNGIAGKTTISAGNINAFLDNDTAGLTSITKTAAGTHDIMIAFGTNSVSILGDPFYMWRFENTSYKAGGSDGFLATTINVGNASYASILSCDKPWGYILHPKGTETAVNTAIGLDDFQAATAYGGIFVYHLLSSDGTVTLSVEDAATNTNPSFAALSGATSGSINASVTPKYGMIALGATATVRRYLRFQVAFGTGTTCSFISGFIRNTAPI